MIRKLLQIMRIQIMWNLLQTYAAFGYCLRLSIQCILKWKGYLWIEFGNKTQILWIYWFNYSNTIQVIPWLRLVANGFLTTEFASSSILEAVNRGTLDGSTPFVKPPSSDLYGTVSVLVSGKIFSYRLLLLTIVFGNSSFSFSWAKSNVRKYRTSEYALNPYSFLLRTLH